MLLKLLKKYFLCLFLMLNFISSICITSPIYGIDTEENWVTYEGLKPIQVPDDQWDLIVPKLLPEDHPIKKQLDEIFSKKDVNYDGLSLYKAGFRLVKAHGSSHVVVFKHVTMKKFIFKTFMDIQNRATPWKDWLKRVKGAELISEKIEELGYEKYFSVPRKWIYLIPSKINDPVGSPFILVCDNMKLVSSNENERYWNQHITFNQLKAFHDILTVCGLWDSVYIFNVPLTKSRKLSFIDTERYNGWPVPYQKVNRYLSEDRVIFWNYLTEHQTTAQIAQSL